MKHRLSDPLCMLMVKEYICVQSIVIIFVIFTKNCDQMLYAVIYSIVCVERQLKLLRF